MRKIAAAAAMSALMLAGCGEPESLSDPNPTFSPESRMRIVLEMAWEETPYDGRDSMCTAFALDPERVTDMMLEAVEYDLSRTAQENIFVDFIVDKCQ